MNRPSQPDLSNEVADDQLPIEVIRHTSSSAIERPQPRKRVLPKLFLLPFVPLLLFTGGVIGIFFQPPALRYFLKFTGLKPGGGTSNPIAVPVETVVIEETKKATVRSVVALGRLIPEGKVLTVSPPYGAGDARIQEIKVAIGSRVNRGDTLALLDNHQSLEAAVVSAEANVALQKATLEQTRKTIAASLDESRAALERAKSIANLATQDHERQEKLFQKKMGSQADIDQANALLSQAQRDVAKAEATVSRFESQRIEDQTDVVVAARKVDTAEADLNRARLDLARGILTAPVSGTILDIHARPGEKPGSKGVMEIGDIQRMTVELEVYQSEISTVTVGQHVEVTSDALRESFHGMVSEIGFAVERQTVMRDDPAANSDARIIKVKVSLDDEASLRVSRLTNLEVTGRIAVEESQ